MQSKRFVMVLLLGSLSGFGQQISKNSDTGPTSVPNKAVSFDLSAIDKTADPCTNFYQYACGNWMKSNPIPDDKVRWGRFDELAERDNYLLYQQVKAAADSPQTPLQKKYGDYFAACMDKDTADKLGIQPLAPVLKDIASWHDRSTYATFVGRMEQKYALGFFFNFGSDQDQKDSTKQIGEIDQSGLSLPDRDYYLQKDERMVKIREQYLAHVTRMFTLLGDTPKQAAVEAKNVLAIETALAEGSMSRVDRREPDNVYHIMTIAELQKQTPEFNWDGPILRPRRNRTWQRSTSPPPISSRR